MPEVGALPWICCGLDFREAHHDPGHSEVGSALSAVADLMRQSEVILLILAASGDRNNVVNFEHVAVDEKVDKFLAKEADRALPGQETVLELVTLSWLQFREK